MSVPFYREQYRVARITSIYIVAALGIMQIKILAFLFVGSKMMCLLDASKVDDALALVTDLSDNLEDRTLEVRLHEGSSVS